MKGDKHRQGVKDMLQSLHHFKSPSTSTASVHVSGLDSNNLETPVASTSSVLSGSATHSTAKIDVHVSKSDTLNGEIWWALKVVSAGYSFKSSEDLGFLWNRQFPDSAIVQASNCGD
jgi:hypothetical protein